MKIEIDSLEVPKTKLFIKRTNFRKVKKQLTKNKCKNCLYYKDNFCTLYGEDNFLNTNENQTCTNFLNRSSIKRQIKESSKGKSIREDKYIQRKRSHIIRTKK